LQRAPSRRAARRRNLLLTPRGPNRHRELAAPLQHDQAARLTWIQATGTGGIRARLRRVAGCAIPSGSAGHAGETANLKLTFHLDHSEGADHAEPHTVRIATTWAPRYAQPRIDPTVIEGLPTRYADLADPNCDLAQLLLLPDRYDAWIAAQAQLDAGE